MFIFGGIPFDWLVLRVTLFFIVLGLLIVINIGVLQTLFEFGVWYCYNSVVLHIDG